MPVSEASLHSSQASMRRHGARTPLSHAYWPELGATWDQGPDCGQLGREAAVLLLDCSGQPAKPSQHNQDQVPAPGCLLSGCKLWSA